MIDHHSTLILMEAMEVLRPNICNFWRRVIALFIDLLIMGVTGLILGLFLGDHFASLGNYARIYGVLICLGYLGVLNSRWGGGQTFGKRLMGIRVVDSQGELLSFGRSAGRTLILIAPQMLNHIYIPANSWSMVLTVLVSIIIFGGGFALFYLYVFNRNTRQSLHDLVVGSYVVSADPVLVEGEVTNVFKLHYWVCGAFPLVLAGFFFLISQVVSKQVSYDHLLSTQSSVQELDFVHYCGVMDMTSYRGGDTPPLKGLKLTAMVGKECIDKEHADEIAEKAKASYPDLSNRDYLSVVLVYAYDIGIWSFSYSYNFSYAPEALFEGQD